MIYRNFAGRDVSLLGFGTMRFPTTSDGKINEPEAERMLDAAYAAGVNYFDTAYPYHDKESEPFVGRVLSKYPRESYAIATKLPVWRIDSAESAVSMFEAQLERLGVDYVDYYLFHSLSRTSWQERVLGFGLIPVFERLCKEGKIRHLGFSFHDKYEAFEEILTYRKWDFCQIQYNYFDTKDGPGRRGYELAERLGVPLAIMEPIRGGSLVQLSDEIKARLAEIDPCRSLADFALSWVASQNNVAVVLSGMSTMEQLNENLKILGDGFRPLSDGELSSVEEIAEQIRALVYNSCTGCRYCMPCPAGVDIPHAFWLLNQSGMFPMQLEGYRRRYLSKSDALASLCVSCGACEEKCPQQITIRSDLKHVVDFFEN
ncbi:MAG: aldo/keto reductase [Clostridia bacterium]|nr:aldo/keto reductase [Clostridia bacterium]